GQLLEIWVSDYGNWGRAKMVVGRAGNGRRAVAVLLLAAVRFLARAFLGLVRASPARGRRRGGGGRGGYLGNSTWCHAHRRLHRRGWKRQRGGTRAACGPRQRAERHGLQLVVRVGAASGGARPSDGREARLAPVLRLLPQRLLVDADALGREADQVGAISLEREGDGQVPHVSVDLGLERQSLLENLAFIVVLRVVHQRDVLLRVGGSLGCRLAHDRVRRGELAEVRGGRGTGCCISCRDARRGRRSSHGNRLAQPDRRVRRGLTRHGRRRTRGARTRHGRGGRSLSSRADVALTAVVIGQGGGRADGRQLLLEGRGRRQHRVLRHGATHGEAVGAAGGGAGLLLHGLQMAAAASGAEGTSRGTGAQLVGEEEVLLRTGNRRRRQIGCSREVLQPGTATSSHRRGLLRDIQHVLPLVHVSARRGDAAVRGMRSGRLVAFGGEAGAARRHRGRRA
ncbi:hypothetical protein PMAYCL1PPCAC_08406, partial [Pristionchus mayeri]